MGGAIFVNTDDGGTLSVDGPLTISGNKAIAGTGTSGLGAAVSEGICGKGTVPLVFNPGAGQEINIYDPIGDNSLQTLLSGQSYNPGKGIGFPLDKNGHGTAILWATGATIRCSK